MKQSLFLIIAVGLRDKKGMKMSPAGQLHLLMWLGPLSKSTFMQLHGCSRNMGDTAEEAMLSSDALRSYHPACNQ